jgi:hypothetical protein
LTGMKYNYYSHKLNEIYRRKNSPKSIKVCKMQMTPLGSKFL